MFLIFIIILVLVFWYLRKYMSEKVETTNYTVLKYEKDYEIRSYQNHIIAQVTVEGDYKEASRKGFRILAGYIFGNNRKKENIAMTSPVTQQENTNQKIAMTSPVLVNLKEEESYKIAFGMPAKYKIEDLPIPNDSRIQILEIETKKVAAMIFSGSISENAIQEKKKEFLEILNQNGISIKSETYYAGYNPPWTLPWMRRNEILVEVL
jgi:hypothetical protein